MFPCPFLSCYSKCNHGKLNCSRQAGEPKITSSAKPSAKFKLKTLLRYSNIGMTSASFLLLIHVLFWFRLCRSNGLLQLHKSWNKRDRVSEDVWETRPEQLCELERMDRWEYTNNMNNRMKEIYYVARGLMLY